MERNELFRKQALDRLQSPDPLDAMMPVVSSKGWVAVLTIGALLAGFLVWSVFGSMSETVAGQGILVAGGGLREIKADGVGVLENLTVRNGDRVTIGQAVGAFAPGSGEEAIRTAQMSLDQAIREAENVKLSNEATIAGLRSNKVLVQAEIVRIAADLEKSKVELARLQELLKMGLTTLARVQAAERDVRANEGKLTAQQESIANIDVQIRTFEQITRTASQRVEDARNRLGAITRDVKRTTTIYATAEGEIIQVNKKPGDRVVAGETVAAIQSPGSRLEAIVYFDLATGKRLAPAVEAQVSPTTVKREEYGYLIGTVESVSQSPVTAEAALAVLRNPILVVDLVGQKPMLEVHVALEPDLTTPSRLKWSSSVGPPSPVDANTRVTVFAVVERQRPISKVLPFMRKTLGL